MASPVYSLNVESILVEKREGGAAVPLLGADGLDGTATAASRLVWSQQGELIRERSDWSHYPTFYSFIHQGWSWRLECKAQDNGALWLRERYLHSISFTGTDCSATTKQTLVFTGIMLEAWESSWQWQELDLLTLGGQALQASLTIHGTPDQTYQLEGDLNIHGRSQTESFPSDGDTVNHWNVTPLT